MTRPFPVAAAQEKEDRARWGYGESDNKSCNKNNRRRRRRRRRGSQEVNSREVVGGVQQTWMTWRTCPDYEKSLSKSHISLVLPDSTTFSNAAVFLLERKCVFFGVVPVSLMHCSSHQRESSLGLMLNEVLLIKNVIYCNLTFGKKTSETVCFLESMAWMLFSSSRRTHHQPSEEKKERLIFKMEPEAAVGSSVFGL